MKAAIEVLREEQFGLCGAAATEEAVAGDTRIELLQEVRDRFAQSAALRRQHAADLDRAIALLEAAPVVLELMRACARRTAAQRRLCEPGCFGVERESSFKAIHEANITEQSALADPLVQKLIAEGE